MNEICWLSVFAIVEIVAVLLAVAGCGKGEPARQVPASVEVRELSAGQDPISDEFLDLPAAMQRTVRAMLETKFGTLADPRAIWLPDESPSLLTGGARVYRQHCVHCHGISGDGAGVQAAVHDPRPRDFRLGIFKFTRTAAGARPRLTDVLATVERGIPGTAMPPFAALTAHERTAVSAFVVSLAQRGELAGRLVFEADGADSLPSDVLDEQVEEVRHAWQEAEELVVTPTLEPPADAASITRGRQAFLSDEFSCYKCHAFDLRGQPDRSLLDLRDAWNQQVPVSDMVADPFRCGPASADLWHAIVEGINGTRMTPSKGQLADRPELAWDLVHFIQEQAAKRAATSSESPSNIVQPGGEPHEVSRP